MKNKIIALFIALVIIVIAVSGLSVSLNPHNDDKTVNNHTFTPIKNETHAARTPDTASIATTEPPKTEPPLTGIEISLNFAGDFLMHDTFIRKTKQSDGTYDFTNLFRKISGAMGDADFTIANLETTFAGQNAGYSGYPRFNTPEAMAYTMKNLLGIDIIMTSNNHCMDKGYEGLVNTLKILDENQLMHTGTYASKEDSEKIQIVDIKGVKFSFLNYTYSLNGNTPPDGYGFCTDLIDLDKIEQDAKKAREAGAEYIICMPHWGVEYNLEESEKQRTQAEWIFANTEIDMIIGGHPHVVQPAEYMTVITKDNKQKTGYILYSLGNFISNHSTEADFIDTGIILNVDLEKSLIDGKISIKNIQYTPVAVDRTVGHDTDNGVINIVDEISAFEEGTADTVTEEEYKEFKRYREYYKSIFERIGMFEKK